MYSVYGIVSGSKFLGTVDAASKDEAIEKVMQEADVQLYYHSAGEWEYAEIMDFQVYEEEDSE